MNLLKRELKTGVKPFCIWTLGILFLVVGGMVKFSGMEDAGGIGEMLAAIPRPVLAMFGMTEANIETLGGFYAVLEFYAAIAIGCYAISLGTASVLRESIDKTYEFLFTKPCGRLYILAVKLLSGFLWLTALCVLNGVFSVLAPGLYGIENSIRGEMPLFALGVYLVALLYFALSVLLSVLIQTPERAVQCSYGCLLAGYAVSVLFDMDERAEALRFLTPFRYFRAGELLQGTLHGGYLAAVLVCIALCLAVSCAAFRKKDLNAV